MSILLNKNLINTYKTILVIDAEQTMRNITADALISLGINNVIKAADGEAALAHIEEMNIDLVLCDFDLPKLTGLELLKITRTNKKTFKIPFIIISTNINYQDVSSAIELGVSDYLVKPYTIKMLETKLEHTLKRPIKEVFSSKAKAKIPKLANSKAHKLTVLIVDDVIDNIKIIAEILRNDYKVIIANNAKKALKICNSDSPPDLMLLDIMMPEMSGLEVCKIVKNNPFTKHITIIFTTALDQPKDIVKGLEVGAVDYITKPISPSILKARVNTHINITKQNNQMRDQVDRMIENSQLRDDFDRFTQYDLRKPIDEIIKSITILNKYKFNDNKYNFSKMILSKNATLLSQSIDNMLTLYKIEDGSYEYSPAPFDLKILIDEVLSAFISTSKDKCFEIDLNLNKSVVLGESLLTRTIISNLIKFSFSTTLRGATIQLILSHKNNLTTFRICLSSVNINFPIEDMFNKNNIHTENKLEALSLYCARSMAEIQNGNLISYWSDADNKELNLELTLNSKA
ncbi:hypothetical protein CJF42_06420 [Pseudoalteromonas sp. NBT06-2]|uniref:response regulator n=1 Tax=Pseudoalteromonas sp. NBT06-2 TaxID=2025950 RepID=UPI000BA584E7|nr:response regulator [Pseudoalteromonas sp. NBT06-2]PAJ75278.1 hypothetical protein CJF42_06420 [Pseudoalteromonas sp. NBT06-2]